MQIMRVSHLKLILLNDFEQSHKSLCRKKHNENKAVWPNHNYKFSPLTANGSLQNHLEKFHKEEYLELCTRNKWHNLLPKPRRDDTVETSIGQNTTDYRPRPQFSRQAFLKHIINFVVADNQVSLIRI
jgi:hypothetical protein